MPMTLKTRNALAWLNVNKDYDGDDCLIWPFGKNRNGLGYYGSGRYAQRTMCELAHGAPPTEKHKASFTCKGQSISCCNPRHLIWRTPSERLKGRKLKPTIVPKEVIAQIQAMPASMTNLAIAAQLHLPESRVRYWRSERPMAWTYQQEQIIRESVARGDTVSETTAALGMSGEEARQRVYDKIRSMGLPINYVSTFWTTERVNLLRDIIEAGATIRAAMVALGLSGEDAYARVYAKCRALKLKPLPATPAKKKRHPPITSEDEVRIRAAHAEGKSTAQIAEMLALSGREGKRRVYDKMLSMGLQPNLEERVYNEERIKILTDNISAGKTISEASKHAGLPGLVGYKKTYMQIRRLGLKPRLEVCKSRAEKPEEQKVEAAPPLDCPNGASVYQELRKIVPRGAHDREDAINAMWVAVADGQTTIERLRSGEWRRFTAQVISQNYEQAGYAYSLDAPNQHGGSWHDVVGAKPE